MEGTNVYISRLSAAFDPIALDESTYSKNVNIVNDPVDDPISKSPRWCREELSLPKNVKLALIAGHLSNRKKILRILKDWPEIYNESGVKLVLAGELKPSNESYEEIKDIIDANKECIIPRLRVISVEDFPRYINAADIVICTYESGTYMPSGLAGLAYVNKVPMIAIDNRYITNLVNSFNFGIGLKHYSSLEFKKAVSLMGNKEATKDDYHIEPTFTHTFEQMFTDCINKRRRHEI